MTKTKTTGTRKEVRKFGILFTGVCIIVALYLLYRGRPIWIWFVGGALFFLLSGFLGYPILRPLYLGWMKFAAILGWINTRLLLGVFFYLILTPIGIVMRLFGKDLLDQRSDRGATTYWKRRTPVPFNRQQYERLF